MDPTDALISIALEAPSRSTADLIPVSRPSIGARESEYVQDAVASGWVSSIGPYIDRFEQQFARFCGVSDAVAVSNGTTALHLALHALGIGPGDEVIVPDLTFVATANAVAYTGAKPVLVDIDPVSLCIDPAAAARAVTARTRAIIPVHLYGQPADMDAIQAIAQENDLYVIEDAAEAHGSEYKGRRVGSLGHCGVFSFYGNKIVTTGEGGMITTNDPALRERIRNLRDHAMSPMRRYWHSEVGFNYRMTNLQAALGLAQLEQIDAFLSRRADVLQQYRQSIRTSDRVRLNASTGRWGRVSVWMVCLEVDWFTEAIRDDFIALLRDRGVDSRPYFRPLSSMPMYSRPALTQAARKAEIGVNLPTFVDLSDDQVRLIAAEVNSALEALEPAPAGQTR